MRMYDLILKKREGGCLTESEINYIVKGYTQGSIPDYQMSAFLMAVYFKGLSDEETFALTKAMTDSGEKLDLSCIPGVKADKHSTGGVGDKTTLVLAPMIASLGINMAKMSGRGLGNTGGTIDKLESFPGFNTSLTNEQFIENIKHIGIAVNGPTLSLAPADKKIYALRDVTATVENVSLIASSIMSKKLAAGADIIVLDVKSGSGAFMKNEHDALQLAHEMVKIGKASNKQTIAVISDMNQPLGHNIGNALEVVEAIETLKGKGPADLHNLCIALGTQILEAAGKASDAAQAKDMLESSLTNGTAYSKFKEFIKTQGGDISNIDNPMKLVNASYIAPVISNSEGYVESIECEQIGRASMILGAGRKDKDSPVDLSAGIVLHKKTGDFVNKNEEIATIYFNKKEVKNDVINIILNSYKIVDKKCEKPELIKQIIK